ncbi:MAG: glycogen-binding domain-containing protein [Elusimicrobiales bacterium]|nr:glycogen-binding domain-containing protein [Elusimicrobiales bacterium]
MKKSKTFWAAAAFASLALMAFAGYSIYERLSLHMSGDSIEVRPVPMPVPEEENTTVEEAKIPAEGKEEPKAAPAAEGAQEPEKIKAVKTVFEYKDAKAKSVKIAGSFTSWRDVKMAKKNGAWRAEIYILPGTYPYHFNVDGKKKLDPGKPKAPTGDSLVDVN